MAYLYIDPTSDLKTSTTLAEIWRGIWWAIGGGGGERERETERERNVNERESEVKHFWV